MRGIIICLLYLLISSLIVHGQGSISGRVTDKAGNALSFASVSVDTLNRQVASDKKGRYYIANIAEGNYRITASMVGFQKQTITVSVDEKRTVGVNFLLEESVSNLNEVAVTGKSEARQVVETGYNVTVIDTRQFENRAMNINQVLNQAAGIRIRETGGLGSSYELMLNGLSSNRIRFFLNGVPLENGGSLFNLNNIPVNLIERIEVYKGAVPIFLGGDALGGAVNIITKQKAWNYLDASYSMGTYNTHLANASGQWADSTSGFTVKSHLLYNYSANNYTMYNLRKEGLVGSPDKYKRFHDAYLSWLGNFELGFTSKKWADRMLFGFGYGTIRDEWQTDNGATKGSDGAYNLSSFGDAFSTEQNQRYTFDYTKRDFLKKKLSITLNAAYRLAQSKSVDTSSRVFNWAGEILSITNKSGETYILKQINEYKQASGIVNSSLVYTFNPRHQIAGSFVWNYLDFQARDIINPNNIRVTPFSEPNWIQKKIIGFSYQNNCFKDRLQTTLFVKNYMLGIYSVKAREYMFEQFVLEDRKTSKNNWGAGVATRYLTLDNKWLLKLSFENAYRLPESYEIFGDGRLILANPDLLAESSKNINVGVQHRFVIGRSNFEISADGFYRNVKNAIFPEQNTGRFAEHKNLDGVLIKGLETEISYRYNSRFRISGNLTYQDVLNNEKYLKGTNNLENFVYRDRMYNTPWLFGNTNAEYIIHNIGARKFKLGIFHSLNYVEEFYLGYSKVARGGKKYTIPTQLIQNAGLTIASKDNRYNLTVECNNIANALAFDSFGLQKPGRMILGKLRYFLQQY